LESRAQISSAGKLHLRSDMHVLTVGSCKIDTTKINLTNYTLQTIDICTQTDNYILQDGFKSFPSGHSSGTTT
jgi:membrane-associated phospholipid phosphatase